MSSMTTTVAAGKGKSLWMAYVLWLVGGYIGLHRYYLGHRDSGALMAGVTGFLSCVGLAFFGFLPSKAMSVVPSLLILFVPMMAWHAVDAFLIPGMLETEEERPDPEDE